MNHLSDDELILHFYGEDAGSPAQQRHLDQCGQCRALYASIERVLHGADSLPVPARDPEYGARIWQRIESRIPARRLWWARPGTWRGVGAAAAFASLLVVAFLAGRLYPTAHKHAPADPIADRQTGERVLRVAVGDFLERSQLVLIELNNADPASKLDISAERERAADLAGENRLYRQSAVHNGNTAMAGVLDDLERVLVDISHAPAQLSPADLEVLQQRLESAGILFEIRVLGTNVKYRQEPAVGQSAGQQKL
jgi:hypothetical protein